MNATLSSVERQVRVVKMAGFDAAIEERKGDLREVFKALGYLSQWAMHNDNPRNASASVVMADNGDMHAVYRDSEGNITYEIGAVMRDGGTYSFHS